VKAFYAHIDIMSTVMVGYLYWCYHHKILDWDAALLWSKHKVCDGWMRDDVAMTTC